jgi:hypothetical protein
MTKKLKARITVLNTYVFTCEVPDDYDQNEKYMLVSDYFEQIPDQNDLLVKTDYQIDDVKELP